MKFFLDFESEIAELEARINELRHVSNVKGTKILDEISNLEFKTKKLLKAKYSSLSPWQRVQVARHPDRPHSSDYIENLFSDFLRLDVINLAVPSAVFKAMFPVKPSVTITFELPLIILLPSM